MIRHTYWRWRWYYISLAMRTVARLAEFEPRLKHRAHHDTAQVMKKFEPGRDPSREDQYVQALFDRMGPTYGVMNLLSSFGFSELWRLRCVRNAGIQPGSRVCDMMSGSGECWKYILRRGGSVVSIDFSEVMCGRQRQRNQNYEMRVDVRCENAMRTSIPSEAIDCVVCAFGLKTLSQEALKAFAFEIRRILRPGGRFSLLEISTAEGWFLSSLYRWYLRTIVPMIGRVCLADIECYRMLGAYTDAFVSCQRVSAAFAEAGLDVAVRRHFHGCATSLVGTKPLKTSS